jgi:hypothetical protein
MRLAPEAIGIAAKQIKQASAGFGLSKSRFTTNDALAKLKKINCLLFIKLL